MIDKNAAYWIENLGMEEHPEGGFYKETYRSEETLNSEALPDRYSQDRCFGTSIYFLLTTESVSNFHRLNSDEIWHFHNGGAGRIHFITQEGQYTHLDIGNSLEKGQQLQIVIPKNSWFAAEVIESDYILVGCTVAPGFEFADFELASKGELSAQYPKFKKVIERFTRAGN